LGPADDFVTGRLSGAGYAPIAFEDAVAADAGELVVFSVEDFS
jgi:hypothetical protein